MKEYRIEKTRVSVTLRLRGSMQLSGSVFVLPESVESLPMRIAELLNAFERFVPFEVSEGRTVVQNKGRVIWCRFDGRAGPVLEVPYPRRRVTLVLEDGTSLSGDIVADGPPDRRRVLDCLNDTKEFLLIETREADYIVRRDAIAWVPSAEMGEPREEERDQFEVEEPAAFAV